jgi:protein-disulfide isomerase
LPIHTHAFKAAEAAHCAGEQGKFWEMHARLFSNQNALAAGGLSQQAQALSLDAGKFNECLSSSKYAELIRNSVATAEKIKIDGTPAFLVGMTDEAGEKIKIVRMLLGAQSYEDMKIVLDELLSSQPRESK